MQRFSVLIKLLVFFSYLSLNLYGEEFEEINSVLNATSYESYVYIGVSPKYSTPEKEIEHAKKHIANQIAMNVNIKTTFGFISSINDVINRTSKDSHFFWIDDEIDEIKDKLQIITIFTFDKLTVVVAKDIESTVSSPLQINKENNKRPYWIRKPPEIEDFYISVGMSEKYSTICKTIVAADMDAAEEISKQKFTYLRAYTYDELVSFNLNHKQYNTNTFKMGTVSLSNTEIYGFRVIDRWIDANGTCYSLAIAEKR